jgi:Leucine-rich repeat (LRR) protein
MYTLFELLFLGGLATAGLALLWMLTRFLRRPKRLSAPLLLAGLGIAIACIPVLYTRFVSQIDLGEHEQIVEGQRHLTLTGWDRGSYEFLKFKNDTTVLQMANPDVTDQTLGYLRDMKDLRELDLDNTEITDAGLKELESLQALERLRLGGTRITDQGFETSLMKLPNLKQLNLRDTQVSDQTIEAWKQAGSGRRVMK